MGLFYVTAKEDENYGYLYGVREADLTLIKKFFGRYALRFFMERKRSLFRIYYKVPRSCLFEIVFLYYGLYKLTKIRRFKSSADSIVKSTWLNVALKSLPDSGATSNIKRFLNIDLVAHQKHFVEIFFSAYKLRHLRGLFLSFDQGLGKTATAITISQLANVEQVVIIVPNALKVNWYNEFRKFVKRYQDEEKAHKEIFIQGVTKKLDPNKAKICIYNIESAKKALSLSKTSVKMLIVDESHTLKEMKSMVTKAVIKLVKDYNIKYVLLQSGTPIKGSPHELLPIFYILDKQMTPESFDIYKRVLKTKNTNLMRIFNMKFNFLAHRKLKIEVEGDLNLPPKVRRDYKIKMPTMKRYTIEYVKQEMKKFMKEFIAKEKPHVKEYQKIIDNIVAKYKDSGVYLQKYYTKYMKIVKAIRNFFEITEADRDFKKIYEKRLKKKMNSTDRKTFTEYIGRANSLYAAALGKAIGNVYMRYHREMVIDIAKYGINAIMEIYNQSEAGKVIIMTSYPEAAQEMVNQIHAKGKNAVKVVGSTPYEKRLKNIEAFLRDPNVHFLVGSLHILSVGLTLIEADTIIFLNEPWRWVDKNQAEDRIHRFGQTRTCYIYTMLLDISEETLSSRNNSIILESKRIFELIIGDESGYRPPLVIKHVSPYGL